VFLEQLASSQMPAHLNWPILAGDGEIEKASIGQPRALHRHVLPVTCLFAWPCRHCSPITRVLTKQP